MNRLPIDEVLPAIVDALRARPRLVLKAPPGAGKTTRVPVALLDAALVAAGEEIWVLEPRRIAARRAAERVARERGTPLGDEIGYQVRFESRASSRTRVRFVTEGILTRRLLRDAELRGRVVAQVADEVADCRHPHPGHRAIRRAVHQLVDFARLEAVFAPDVRVVWLHGAAAFVGEPPALSPDQRPRPLR